MFFSICTGRVIRTYEQMKVAALNGECINFVIMRKSILNRLGIGVMLFFFAACGPSRFVEPLEKGENAINVSLGGPLANVPGVATLPLPFTSIGYGRGVTSNITAYGSWYSTAAVFGVAQFDAGATIRMLESVKQKHGFSISPGFNAGLDFYAGNYRFWPQFDAHYYWRYNNRQMVQDDLLINGGNPPKSNLFYAGLGTWFELNGTRAHEQKQNTRIVPTLNIGHDLNWKKWTFKTEVKLIAPFSSNQDIVVDYVSLMGNRGATGVYFGFTRRF